MARRAQELSALQVARLHVPGMHAVGGVAGLYLQVKPPSRTWVLRATVGGRRRDMGLGGFPDVPLAMAREKARQARLLIDQGGDPIEARREAKSALKATAAAAKTFAECATAFTTAKADEWRNPKHRAQWTATLEKYAIPTIGGLHVKDVALPHVLQILEPIWKIKTETATRVRGRIEQVLDWATVRGFRTGDNPARWRGHLDKLLAAPTKLKQVEHHAALPIGSMPDFIEALRLQAGTGARALEFLILTAARSGEVRGATWTEIDKKAAVWTIPKERMKAGREHRVPLSTAALKILDDMPRIEGCALLFPSPRLKAMSDMTLTAVTRRMGTPAVPHGFRSTFRDWAAERTSYPRDVAEMALAHAIGDKVEAAYRRGDLFAKRSRMMEDWGKFCGTPRQAAQVMELKRKK